MLEAISVAGGRYRVNDPALVLNASGDLRVLRLQYNRLLAQRARLAAELNDANAMTVPPELQRQQNNPEVAQLVQTEQALFTAHHDAESSEMDALNQLKSLLNGEVASLQQKMSNLDQELGLRKQELNNTTALVQRGLAIAPREYELRETELETEGRRFDLDTASLRAKEDIGKADQSMVELRNKDHNEIQSELAEIEQKIPETAARIATSATIVDRESSAASVNSADATAEDPPAICLILRTSDGKAKQVNGDESTQVEPGDTIKGFRAGSGKSALDGVATLSGSASFPGNALLPGNVLLPGTASLAADPAEHAEVPSPPNPPTPPLACRPSGRSRPLWSRLVGEDGVGGDAEIDLLHLGIVGEALRGAFEHGAAGLQHIGVIGDFQRQRDRLLGDQQRHPLVMQPRERFVERFDDRRREAEARLVEQ